MARTVKDFEQAIVKLADRYITDLTAVCNLLQDKELASDIKRHELSNTLMSKIFNMQIMLDNEMKMQERNCVTIEGECSTIG
jgi:hypothetical protein